MGVAVQIANKSAQALFIEAFRSIVFCYLLFLRKIKMEMKRIFLSLIIAMALPLFGNPVDENTAKQLAQNFWKENNIIGVRGGEVIKKSMDEARFVNVAPQSVYNEFYIFNNVDGEGFVIIAADDCVTPILGYSYDNNFIIENMPPNVKGWLDSYAEQIRTAVEMRAEATEEIRAEWECLRQGLNLPVKSETAVNPLVTTTWNQGQYYNMMCPEDNSGPDGHALTGCAATAMAQILRFWGYPNDAHSVVWHEYEHPVYGILGANYTYAGGSYYWSIMPNQLTSGSSMNQKQAVASLMYHCGVSLEMNYGPDVSLAYSTAAEIAFRAFFDYNNATLVMKPSNDSQWINTLKNELNNGRPVFYAGTGPEGGHAFVCDGYNNSNYFHFNWGYSGQGDGYFSINSLTPTVYGYQLNYSYNQQAIIGIEPGGTNNYHTLGMNDYTKINGDDEFYYSDTPVQVITSEIFNWGNEAFNGSLCAVVLDSEGLYVAESDFIDNCQIQPMQSSGQLSFTFSEPLNILTCKAYVGIFSIENNQPSLVSPYGFHTNYREFYNDYTQSGDLFYLCLYSDIEYTPTTIVQNSALNVTANIINDDISTFNGYYAAALYSLNGELKQILAGLHEGNGLQPNYHYVNPLNFSCPAVTVPAGTYYLTIIEQVEGSDNWYPLFNWEDCDNPIYVNPIRVDVIGTTSYTITATANPNNGGSITGQGEYNEGETCTLIATANNGYTFVNWTENGTQVSTNANYTFTVTSNRNLIAIFQAQQQQYTVIVQANPSNGGSVSGGGTYQQGQTCTISATPNTGFSFYQWNDGVTTNPRTITVTQDTTFVAFFQNNSTQGGGGFSVSASNKVLISKGNLQYQASTGIWRFAEHQYDAIGLANSNISPNYEGWIDLFGWGTSGYNHGAVCYQPWSTSVTNQDYYAYGSSNYNLYDQTGQADWGYNAISNGGNEINQWRTLTNDEWYYLFNTRNASTVNGVSNARYAKAQVENIHGVIIFPDNYSHPSNVTQPVGINETGNAGWNGNNYSSIEWVSMEANGAVFLPVTGYRDGTSVNDFGAYGNYWSATVYQNNVYTMNFHDTYISQGGMSGSGRYHGTGVRLVQNYQEYSILGHAMPVEGGEIGGSGLYVSGSECTLTATANSGYSFVNWTEGGAQVSTSPNYTFIVTCNRNLVANFQAQQQQYVVSVTANPSNGGNVTGGGSFNPGASCTVQATANSGYVFVNWTENGTQVSTNTNYTFTIIGNRNLVANFEEQLPEYSVSVSSNPSNGGNVTGGGTYTQGQSCTVSASAFDGYIFVNWTENGTQVSSNANYTFEVTGNRTLVANFQIQSYTISVAANPSNGGTVTGGGTYEHGQTCTVMANAGNGFNFVNWTENGVQVSTNACYSFTVTSNRNLVANFTSQSFVITATADPSVGGVITGSGGYNYGETCTLTAIPNTGYTFVNWTKNGTQVSTNSTYSFTVTESATYVAHFNLQSYSITVAAYPNNAGSVTGGGSYNYGQTCTVHATANDGYTFTNWTENGSQVSTNANYSFTVTGNRNLVANFSQNTYTIQASAGANGTITPSGAVMVAHGANQTFSMIPDADYEVQEVYIDGNPVGALTSYTFTNVTANHYIHVSFAHVEAVGENHENTINVYPNPTNDIVIIEGEGMSHIRVVNVFGQVVYDTNVVDEQVSINLSSIAKGIYMLQIESHGRFNYKKIVVR